MGEQISKTWSIHTGEYDSAMKRSKALTPAAPWMDLEAMILRERSRHTSHCGKNIQNRKIHMRQELDW